MTRLAALALLLALPAAASSGRQGKVAPIEPLNPGLSPHGIMLVNALTAITPLAPSALSQKAQAQLDPVAISAPAPVPTPLSQIMPGVTLEVARPQETPDAHSYSVKWDNAQADLHPFDLVTPPDLGALDTREVRAKNAAPSAMPGFFGKWATARRLTAIKSERMTTEEHATRDSLVNVHALIKAGDPQSALDELTNSFDNSRARDWYAENPDFKPYWRTAMGYYRAVESGLKKDLMSAKRRGQDPVHLAEAKATGVWKPTRIQDAHSGHCAFHAWHNAIAATVGFADKLGVSALISKARAAINAKQKPLDVDLATARSLGIREKARDIGDGMDETSTKEFSDWLGVPYEKVKTPATEAGLLALLRTGKPILHVLRLFHDSHRYEPGMAKVLGHDHPAGHHAVFLLNAFRSPALGGQWLFVVQDSGSGSTDFYTFQELRHLTRELEVLSPRGPVTLPD